MKLFILILAPLFSSIAFPYQFINKEVQITKNIGDSLPRLELNADYQAKNIISQDGSISLITGTYNDRYQADSINKTGYLYVEVKVSDLVQTSVKKLPLNISVVVDRSGSMAGDKIEFAKKAAKRIVDRIDSTDYISIVEYDNFVNVIQKATLDSNKKEIKKRIDKMASRGSTNLWGGTQKGYEEILANYNQNAINRVLLISDGQANVGITNPASIKNQVRQYRDSGISLSTFGVGLDYNELLMTEMAETGSGNYYFIDSVSKMPLLFEKELSSMLSLAARKVILTINVPAGIKLDCLTGDVFDQNGSRLTLRLDNLFSNETKSILFRFTIPDKTKSVLKFNTGLSYVNYGSGKGELSNENLLLPVKNKKAYLSNFNREVTNEVILTSILNNMERALLLSDEGNYAAAKELLIINREYLKNNTSFIERSLELTRAQVTNQHYLDALSGIKKLNKDSIKLLQKINREVIYELRNKKKEAP